MANNDAPSNNDHILDVRGLRTFFYTEAGVVRAVGRSRSWSATTSMTMPFPSNSSRASTGAGRVVTVISGLPHPVGPTRSLDPLARLFRLYRLWVRGYPEMYRNYYHHPRR